MYRRPKYIEPHKVFIYVDCPAQTLGLETYVKLWVRNCPQAWMRQVCADLKRFSILNKINISAKQDAVYRQRYYNDYYELAGVTTHDLSLLKELVALMFRKIQGTSIEWLNIHRFLNLRIWKRKEA